MSASDQRKGRDGCRTYYWTKDYTAQHRIHRKNIDHCNIMIDVDYYVDMPTYLCDNFQPTLLYSFQPTQVARNGGEYSYTFNSDASVTYLVSGGGKYQHHVWNYGCDNIQVRKTFLGITYKCATFQVDKQRVDDDHDLICLTPLRSYWGLPAYLAYSYIPGPDLNRLNPVDDSFLRLQVHTADGTFISTGKVGALAQCKIRQEVDDALGSKARTNKYDLTLAHASDAANGQKEGAALLLEYHRTKSPFKPPVVCPVQDSVRRYQFDISGYDPYAKPGLTAFMSPIVHGAFSPDQTTANAQVGVDNRIKGIKAGFITKTPLMEKYIEEFLELLIPKPHTGHPVDHDVVVERQKRPAQRKILEQAEGRPDSGVGTSFIKKEPYPDIKDPRLITQIDGPNKRDYSRYTYAYVDDCLGDQPWYAFCRKPIEIALQIAKICVTALWMILTDFTRFDGYTSNIMRELELRVLLRFFAHEHHDEIMKLHRSQYGTKVYQGDIQYDLDYARASGSPETACMNSTDNAFIAYCTLREMGHDKHTAWSKLGMYGGDDGATPDADPAVYARTAKMFGHELKAEKIERGQPGIIFLARAYGPGVWQGETNTCCDIQRQIKKFHTTVALPASVTPAMKLLEKIRAYGQTDSHTPIIGDLVQKVAQIWGQPIEHNEELRLMTAWGSTLPMEDQYPNEPADWMFPFCESQLPDFDYRKFRSWLDQCVSLEDILAAPMFCEPPPASTKVPAVVNDGEDIVLPSKPYVPPPEPKKIDIPFDPRQPLWWVNFCVCGARYTEDPDDKFCGMCGRKVDTTGASFLKDDNTPGVFMPPAPSPTPLAQTKAPQEAKSKEPLPPKSPAATSAQAPKSKDPAPATKVPATNNVPTPQKPTSPGTPIQPGTAMKAPQAPTTCFGLSSPHWPTICTNGHVTASTNFMSAFDSSAPVKCVISYELIEDSNPDKAAFLKLLKTVPPKTAKDLSRTIKKPTLKTKWLQLTGALPTPT